ncbi:MAG TPA: DUF6390 family protein [Acidimicrobiales bacterium]|nr:DUF6390 family protein [Acidimicrobiales bacterium]
MTRPGHATAPLASDRATPGAVLFARYAYPPNALGYCGPNDPAALLSAASDGSDLAVLGHLATRFEGAWPYLQLIAGCNKIADPLDRRVVDAYWVGNTLLDRVPPRALAASLGERFEHRAGRDLYSIASAAVALGGIAHHSFHVLAVYPWLGLLRAGMEGAPLTVLDRCRIRSGTIVTLSGDAAVVLTRPLELEGSRLVLGAARLERVRCSRDGAGFVDDLAPGDVVSLHWDWVCDRLSPSKRARLGRATARNLGAVNALEVPGHAAAIDARGG